MSHARWLACLALAVLFALPGHAQTPTTPSCVRALGDYDSQLALAQQASRLRYADCWRRWASIGIDRAYKTIGGDVDDYGANLRAATFAAINAEETTATRLLASEQQSERAALERTFEEETRAILAQATPQNRPETNQKRAELRQRLYTESATLAEKLADESASLRARVTRAEMQATAEIARRVDDERESLAEQHRTKIREIEGVVSGLANAEAGQSLATFGSRESGIFATLSALFQYTSAVVGQPGLVEPRAVQYDSIMFRDQNPGVP